MREIASGNVAEYKHVVFLNEHIEKIMFVHPCKKLLGIGRRNVVVCYPGLERIHAGCFYSIQVICVSEIEI